MTTLNVGLAILALGALAGGSSLAAASPPADVRTVTVRYAPAALDSNEGAQQLYRRIQVAARQACGDSDPRDIVHYFLFKGCYQSAVDTAVAKVDATRLTALHRKAQHTSPG